VSIQARQELIKKLVFQKDSQRSDLLDPALTQTSLIALLLDVARYFTVEITAIRSDHHDDSALGPHSHAAGYAVDLWPLRSYKASDYVDADDQSFRLFLQTVARCPWLAQIGLAGSADTLENRLSSGSTVFGDSGGDHVHLGAQ
jgi:hypothetical protein